MCDELPPLQTDDFVCSFFPPPILFNTNDKLAIMHMSAAN